MTAQSILRRSSTVFFEDPARANDDPPALTNQSQMRNTMTNSIEGIPIILALLVTIMACDPETDEGDSYATGLTGKDLQVTEVRSQAPAPTDDAIALAESAGPAEISEEATVLDPEGNVLREGTNAWTCFAYSNEPICADEQWMTWIEAYLNQEDEVDITGVGVAYVLQGDNGRSNIHPYAEEPTADNEWVETGPHIMLIVPDPARLEGIPTDPEEGGPYVMWPDTPFEHLMIFVEDDAIEMPYRKGQ